MVSVKTRHSPGCTVAISTPNSGGHGLRGEWGRGGLFTLRCAAVRQGWCVHFGLAVVLVGYCLHILLWRAQQDKPAHVSTSRGSCLVLPWYQYATALV